MLVCSLFRVGIGKCLLRRCLANVPGINAFGVSGDFNGIGSPGTAASIGLEKAWFHSELYYPGERNEIGKTELGIRDIGAYAHGIQLQLGHKRVATAEDKENHRVYELDSLLRDKLRSRH
jgi:hypothetical protein